MRRIILAAAIAAIPLPAAAVCVPNAFGSMTCNDPSDPQQRGPIQSSRNIYGGFDYSNGWSSRPNIFGGQDYTGPRPGQSMSCRPNIFGGQDCE
jgi:hypothetical protein